MEIRIRDIRMGEEEEVRNLGLRTFHSLEGIFIPKTEYTKVATVCDSIVGAMVYRLVHFEEDAFLYIRYAFIDPRYRGQGIGRKLYENAIYDLKREEKCSRMIALVRSDNVASFSLFERNGLTRCSLFQVAQQLGLEGMRELCLHTDYLYSPGMDLYCTDVKEKKNSVWSIFTYLFINLIFLALGGAFFGRHILSHMGAGLIVMGLTALLGSAVCFVDRGNWSFRFSNCGPVVPFVISLFGGFFPMLGRWYPSDYEDTDLSRQFLGISALAEWGGLFVVELILGIANPKILLFQKIRFFIRTALIYRLLPTYPFGDFGAERVHKYNRYIYLGCFFATILLLYFV